MSAGGRRWRAACGGIAAMLFLAVAMAAEPVGLTLAEALEEARSATPTVRVADARVAEARGELVDARRLATRNPELRAAGNPFVRDEVAPEVPVSAEAEVWFDAPGSRVARVQAAREGLGAAEAEFGDFERRRSLGVATAFYAAVEASERLGVAREDLALAEELRGIAATRVGLGADPPVNLNTAVIRLAEARRGEQTATADHRSAVVRLGTLLGRPADAALDLVGELPRVPTLELGLAELLVRLDVRSDVVAARQAAVAARADLRVARTTTWPGFGVGIQYDGLNMPWPQATLALEIPVLDTNAGARAVARARLEGATAAVEATRLDAEGDLRAAWARFEGAAAAVALYDAEVLAALDENVVLLRRMYEAGKVDYAAVVALQRERLVGALGYLEARLSLALAEAELRSAAGLPLAEDGGAR